MYVVYRTLVKAMLDGSSFWEQGASGTGAGVELGAGGAVLSQVITGQVWDMGSQVIMGQEQV